MHIETALQTVFSRYVDGGHPVYICQGGGYQLNRGVVETFSSARQLLITLTGHPDGRHWTFDRYFRLGRWAHRTEMGENLPPVGGSILDILTTAHGPIILVPRVILGIDLRKRGSEVAKLLMAGFGRRIFASGYDFDDVLQEVYQAILVRNHGTCPWDERKSSFGHYVHMVAGCVLSNYHRKCSRQRGHGKEQLGMITGGDAALGAVAPPGHDQLPIDDLSQFIDGSSVGALQERQLLIQALPLVQEGRGRSEIALALGISKPLASKVLMALRQFTRRWMAACSRA